MRQVAAVGKSWDAMHIATARKGSVADERVDPSLLDSSGPKVFQLHTMDLAGHLQGHSKRR